MAPVKDWRLIAIVDRGPGQYYRFQVRGENLNFAEDHPDRHFSWSVRDIDNPRYDTANAVREPSVALETLATGVRFRHAGYPDKFKAYIARGNGWYSSEEGYDGGPWHSPELHVVVLK